jgi:hypothetical protein
LSQPAPAISSSSAGPPASPTAPSEGGLGPEPTDAIAITQLQREGPGKTYLEHRRAQGDTKPEAIRALRRRISDEVFRRMRHDEAAKAAGPSGLAAAA